ncbi:MAG: ISAs1 family transposase [Legionella sp.]|nr:ISAs1 family transposase [Legionella sp.]
MAQEKVDEKSNEITAIPNLLSRLDLVGQIVTLDAMGCQKGICEQIVAQGGDYVIYLKGNQGRLHDDVREWFADKTQSIDHEWEEWGKGHGRIEHRRCITAKDIDWLSQRHNWPGLKSIAVVESERTTSKGIQKEKRYYISSLNPCAERIAHTA